MGFCSMVKVERWGWRYGFCTRSKLPLPIDTSTGGRYDTDWAAKRCRNRTRIQVFVLKNLKYYRSFVETRNLFSLDWDRTSTFVISEAKHWPWFLTTVMVFLSHGILVKWCLSFRRYGLIPLSLTPRTLLIIDINHEMPVVLLPISSFVNDNCAWLQFVLVRYVSSSISRFLKRVCQGEA